MSGQEARAIQDMNIEEHMMVYEQMQTEYGRGLGGKGGRPETIFGMQPFYTGMDGLGNKELAQIHGFLNPLGVGVAGREISKEALPGLKGLFSPFDYGGKHYGTDMDISTEAGQALFREKAEAWVNKYIPEEGREDFYSGAIGFIQGVHAIREGDPGIAETTMFGKTYGSRHTILPLDELLDRPFMSGMKGSTFRSNDMFRFMDEVYSQTAWDALGDSEGQSEAFYGTIRDKGIFFDANSDLIPGVDRDRITMPVRYGGKTFKDPSNISGWATDLWQGTFGSGDAGAAGEWGFLHEYEGQLPEVLKQIPKADVLA